MRWPKTNYFETINFKIVLVIIRFIVASFDLLKTLIGLKQAVEKSAWTVFVLPASRINARANESWKNAAFYNPSRRWNFHLNEKIYITWIIWTGWLSNFVYASSTDQLLKNLKIEPSNFTIPSRVKSKTIKNGIAFVLDVHQLKETVWSLHRVW